MNFTPTNELEKALMQAATNDAARPRFYQLLLTSPLFILMPPDVAPHGRGVLKPGVQVPVVHWADNDRQIVPLFTSLAVLQETLKNANARFDYLSMRGVEVLGIVSKGEVSAILNPKGPYGKELLIGEMRDLVSGKFFGDEKAQEGTLTQLAEQPTALIEALKQFLSTKPEVSAAYVAQATYSGKPEPRFFFALQMEGDPDPVMKQMSVILGETLGKGKSANFTVVGRGGQFDEYFLKNQPFYKKEIPAT
jgi:hypothetical protein